MIQNKFSYYFTNIKENTLSILFYNINSAYLQSNIEQDFISTVIHWFEANAMYCGVSTIFSDIMEIDSYKFMAEDALNLSTKSKGNEYVKPFEKYILNCMVDRIKTTDYWTVYIHPYLAQLKEYDTKYNTDYFNTLKIYILSFKDMSYTAAALNIQRNSLKYRLQKINEITGIDYFNNRLCAQLLYNFYMLDS